MSQPLVRHSSCAASSTILKSRQLKFPYITTILDRDSSSYIYLNICSLTRASETKTYNYDDTNWLCFCVCVFVFGFLLRVLFSSFCRFVFIFVFSSLVVVVAYLQIERRQDMWQVRLVVVIPPCSFMLFYLTCFKHFMQPCQRVRLYVCACVCLR